MIQLPVLWIFVRVLTRPGNPLRTPSRPCWLADRDWTAPASVWMSWLRVGWASLSRLLVVLSAVARLSIADPSWARDPARPVIKVSKFPIS